MSATQNSLGGARVRFPPPLVFLVFAGLGFALDAFVIALDLPLGLVPRLCAGAVPALSGVALIGWALGLFRRTGQDPTPWSPTPALVLRGPYRFTRNPMYVGMAAVHVGLSLGAGSGWVLALAPAALLCVHFLAVRPEEAYLAERFGESYRRYAAAVRRYL